MKKYLLFTTCLMLLVFWPIQAQEVAHSVSGPASESRPNAPERFTTIAETNYLNDLALRGFNLDTQGLLVESLDGNQIFADLNSNAGFNPASSPKLPPRSQLFSNWVRNTTLKQLSMQMVRSPKRPVL